VRHGGIDQDRVGTDVIVERAICKPMQRREVTAVEAGGRLPARAMDQLHEAGVGWIGQESGHGNRVSAWYSQQLYAMTAIRVRMRIVGCAGHGQCGR